MSFPEDRLDLENSLEKLFWVDCDSPRSVSLDHCVSLTNLPCTGFVGTAGNLPSRIRVVRSSIFSTQLMLWQSLIHSSLSSSSTNELSCWLNTSISSSVSQPKSTSHTKPSKT